MTGEASRGRPRYLVEAIPGDKVQVRMVALEFVPYSCWDLRIRMGDVFQHLERRTDGILLERSTGERVLIPEDAARFIGVRPLT